MRTKVWHTKIMVTLFFMREERREEDRLQRLFMVSAFSLPQQFFKGMWLMHLHICQGQMNSQRGGGQLNHETEMKDDEWLIKEKDE